jgi:glycosyltransferase involved in cell wall biosynthesis
MASPDFEVTIVTPRARGAEIYPAQIAQALPHTSRVIPYDWVPGDREDIVEKLFESRFDTRVDGHHVAYIFPDASLSLLEELRQRNVPIIREMINCHRGTAKRILDEAYSHIGVAPRHAITEDSVRWERSALEFADFVFCPNKMVELSLLENGVPSSKLLESSYGWDPARFSRSQKRLSPIDGLTILFVGSISVRKGAHLLLEYWAKSGIRGRLVLAGDIEPIIKMRWSHLLAREDVQVLSYVRDVGSLYRSADVFVFPTLEEGGPQVTYEACGCGLPVITTPMGAGRVVRHDIEGFVLDPTDEEGWIAAARALADDANLRQEMGAAALTAAQSFRWPDVARRRRESIVQRLGLHSLSAVGE